MLCKLYSAGDVIVQTASWKKRSIHQPQPTVCQAGHNGQIDHSQLLARIEELNSELDRRAKEGWEQGFKAGETTARKNLEDQVQAAVAALANTATQVASTRADVMRHAEADTVRLSIEIARRVLHREISIDPAALGSLIKAALEKLSNQEVYRLRIHPGHEKIMRSYLEQAGRESIEVVSDASQPSGGALFEISRGSLDSSVETQLREIERGLIDEIRRRG